MPLADELRSAKERILILERELDAQNEFFQLEQDKFKVKTEALESELRKS
jgi:hypothetical protein